MTNTSLPLAPHIRASLASFAHHFGPPTDENAILRSAFDFVHVKTGQRRVRKNGRRFDVLCAPPEVCDRACVTAEVAFAVGKRPEVSIELVFGSQRAAHAAARDIRQLVHRAEYRQLFPHVRLAETDTDEVLRFTGGARILVRTFEDEPPADFRPDLIIMVSPQRARDVRSARSRHASFARFKADLHRLADGGSVAVIASRMHLHDIPGHLAREKRFTIWPFPAVAQGVVTYQCGNHGQKVLPDQLLDARLLSHGRLAELLQELGEDRFSALYLQAPLPT